MKPYGIPRLKELVWPDRADLGYFGKIRTYTKRRTRRMWKRKARIVNKRLARKALKEQED